MWTEQQCTYAVDTAVICFLKEDMYSQKTKYMYICTGVNQTVECRAHTKEQKKERERAPAHTITSKRSINIFS
jgi:hypothetical protein